MSGSLTVYVTSSGPVGHAYIGLTDNSGVTSYVGFVPADRSSYFTRTFGPGTVAPPLPPVGGSVTFSSGSYSLTTAQVNAVNAYISSSINGTYDFLSYNCADFANGVLGTAGINASLGSIFSPMQMFRTGAVGLYILNNSSGWIDPYTMLATGFSPRSAPGAGGVSGVYHNATQSPIVFDLDGDGLEYRTLAGNHVYFDIDNDNFAERIEWLDGDDGFLVRDLNGDGQINSVVEMFGDDGGTTAYQKLGLLDGNGSGTLTSADSAWSSLRLWQDANANARVDAGELKTLGQRGITSIGVVPTGATVFEGHAVAGTSTYVMNGVTRNAADVLFETDQVDSWYMGRYTLDPDAVFLPASRGYGTLHSLQYAMSQDDGLKTAVKAFVALDISGEMHEVYGLVENIVLKWAGTANVTPGARGEYIDNRHLSALEKIHDLPYYYYYEDTPLVPEYYGDDLGKEYALFFNEVLMRLLVQGPLQIVFQNANYNIEEDALKLNDTLPGILVQARANAPAGSADATVYWNEIARIVTAHSDQLDIGQAAAKLAVDQAAGFLTHVVTVTGTSGDDYLKASSPGATWLEGSSDVFWGGAGDDFFGMGQGSDYVLIGNEAGDDVVWEGRGDYNGIILTSALSRDIKWSVSDDNIVLTMASSNQTITIEDQLQMAWYSNNTLYLRTHDHEVQEIQFGDGTIWNQQTFEDVARGVMTAPVPLTGTAGNDVLVAGADTLNLIGGGGADRFVIGLHASRFVTIADFKPADGDRIDISAFRAITSFDQLGLVDRAGHATLVLPAFEGDLQLNASGIGSGRLTIADFLSDTLSYGAGTTINGGSNADSISGTIGDDLLFGNGGDDLVSGDTGRDTIWGWTGADTLNGGYGDDVIGGDQDNDLLNGGSGDDALHGDVGADALNGGDGNDALVGGAGADAIDGGGGTDTAGYSGSAAVTVNLASNINGGGEAAGDVLTDVENLLGGTSADTLSGDFAANILSGGQGNDVLNGGGGGGDALRGNEGDDTLIGGDGGDWLEGGAGADSVDGGNGIDTLSYGASALAVTVNLASGINAGGDAQGDVIRQVEWIHGSGHHDTLTGNGNDNSFHGNDGNDVLGGAGGADLLHGDNGNDNITGGAGDDWLDGGAGDDLFVFAAGHGLDVIGGFEGEGIAGGDRIRFVGISGFGTFAAVQAATSYDFVAQQALIDLGGGNFITVTGISQALVAGDFSFM